MQLDLDRENGKYLSPDADRTVRNLYTLHRYCSASVSSICCSLHVFIASVRVASDLSALFDEFIDGCSCLVIFYLVVCDLVYDVMMSNFVLYKF